jgi:DNA polymerase-1
MNLLWRAAYGFPARIKTRRGVDRTGVFGFFALLRVGLREVTPAPECVVCFDGEYGTTERIKIDPGYKDRGSVDMTPIESLPDVLRRLDQIGIRWFFDDYMEADDVVAKIVARDAGVALS